MQRKARAKFYKLTLSQYLFFALSTRQKHKTKTRENENEALQVKSTLLPT